MRVLYFIFTIALTSCAFNGSFLHPDTSQNSTYNLNSGATVKFDTVSFEPEFLDSLGNPMDLGYELDNFTFQGSSGKLNGWHLKPQSEPDVTIIHFHGNAGFLLSQIKAIDPLVGEGMEVFMFDYSGFGFSDGQATRKNVINDARYFVNYVIEQTMESNTLKVIYGQSLGGHLTAAVAHEVENLIDGIVIEGAFSSHSDIAGKVVPVLGNIFIQEMYSGKREIKNFSKPVLIIHSTEDQTIPFKHGQRLFKKANQPKTFFEIDKCHICGPKYYSKEIAKKIREILAVM